ncbi:MAG: NADH-quinone oxidoreductase subunit [Chitinophagaceae bacterium]|nr:NADH-quinone oxidoreductase subunit [Chitinophagaceae bacterium]
MINFIWLVPLLPLIGFLLLSFGSRKFSEGVSSLIGCGSILGSFIITAVTFVSFLSGDHAAVKVDCFDWISAGVINISFSFLIDSLSLMMMMIITGIGFLIHLYSSSYMHGDEGFTRYFSYLNLFIVSMLLLVMGSNYVVMFAGWEGVGLCSYLLIGFWFKNDPYNDAAKKAFIMNRIGDLGFLMGLALIFKTFGTFDYAEIFAAAPNLINPSTESIVIIAITLLLFIGATGKSAQIPLYTWLPDAMAGPTPVSALIHAATMVTAGIYMIIRSNVLYTMAPTTLAVITGIGIATAIFAATIGLVQNDIKKVLAYSTVSQLGYMFFALGLGAYNTAFFHVMTHAFFKALMFLGAGSVIHAMSGEQDMRFMGGLRKKLPITFITFLIGTLAIAGIPPFAGFFSKDEILAAAYAQSPILWGLGLIGAMFTTFYMFRLVFLTFFGDFRGTSDQAHHLHESPWKMTVPLMILAALSTFGGFLGVPEVLGGSNWIKSFLGSVINYEHGHVAHHLDHATEYTLMAASVGVALVMIVIAWVMYGVKKQVPSRNEAEFSAPTKLLYNKYFIDELYDILFVKPLYFLSKLTHSIIENKIIDGIVNAIGWLVGFGGQALRVLQNGSVSFYLFLMVMGTTLLLTLVTYFIKN